MKEKLGSMEMDYSAQAWVDLEQKLDLIDATATPAASTSAMNGLWAGAIAAAILTTIMVSVPVLSENEQPSSNQEVVATAAVDDAKEDSEGKTDGTIEAQEIHEITLVTIDRKVKAATSALSEDYRLEEDNGDIDDEFKEKIEEEELSTELGEVGLNNSLTEIEDFEIKAKGIQCPGSPVEFSAVGLTDQQEIAWLFEGILPKEGNSVYHAFEEPGLHEVVAIVSNKNSNASVEHVHTIEIFDRPSTSISVELIPSETCFNQTVIASATPSTNAYSWSVGIGRDRAAEKLEFDAMPGLYTINTLATNPQGCTQRFEKEIKVVPSFTVWTPNAFSPDGNTVNDEWFPTGLDKKGMTFTLEVFRANGALVYETSELKPWNGSIRGTSERPRAGEVFSWRYVAKDACGNTLKDGGALTVMR